MPSSIRRPRSAAPTSEPTTPARAARPRSDDDRPAFPRALVVAAASVVVIAGIRAAQDLVGSVLVACFLAILSYPLVSSLELRGVPRSLAVLFVVVLDATILVGVGLLLASLVSDLSIEPERLAEPMMAAITDVARWLERFGVVLGSSAAKGTAAVDGAVGGAMGSIVDDGAIVRMVTGTIGGVATVLSHTLIITLLMVFILLEAAMFPWKVRAALGDAKADLSALAKITSEVQRYLRLKTIINAASGISIATLLGALGIHYAPLWGVLVFFLNYIPSLGSMIALALVALVTLAQLGPAWAIFAGVATVVIHTLILNVLEPAWLGRRFGLSSLAVFLSLLAWGWVLGPLGMLFAVPLTVIVKIGLEHSERHRWVGVLLEPGRSLFDRPPGSRP
ncbi:AI-2E family transporter [Myxococcota bacterium]|nr:AI-2E family transporter [Myxococcota bacterium]